MNRDRFARFAQIVAKRHLAVIAAIASQDALQSLGYLQEVSRRCMYEALITLYTDEYLVMLKNFYTHHGFDVEVVEELVGVEELVDDN